MAAQITFRRSGALKGLTGVQITTFEANSAGCRGEQNGWVTNLSSKEMSQRPHCFYRHVQNPARACTLRNAIEHSLYYNSCDGPVYLIRCSLGCSAGRLPVKHRGSLRRNTQHEDFRGSPDRRDGSWGQRYWGSLLHAGSTRAGQGRSCTEARRHRRSFIAQQLPEGRTYCPFGRRSPSEWQAITQ